MLGVWHFIVVNRENNSPGQAELNINSIGRTITSKLNIHIPVITEESEINSDSDESTDELDDITEGETFMEAEEGKDRKSSPKNLPDDTDPKRITVNNYGTVQNQKFISIETMNGDINL